MSQEPVDLDALENWLIDNQHRSKFTLDAGINIDDANLFRLAIAELRELRTKKSTIFEAITTRGQLALEELENLRAWKERIGPVEIALVNLVAHLDLVHADDEYRNVWACAQIHLGPYRGATYTKQLDEARVLLEKAKKTE